MPGSCTCGVRCRDAHRLPRTVAGRHQLLRRCPRTRAAWRWWSMLHPIPTAIGQLLRPHDLTPVALLLTHAHIDHLGGAGSVARSSRGERLSPSRRRLAGRVA